MLKRSSTHTDEHQRDGAGKRPKSGNAVADSESTARARTLQSMLDRIIPQENDCYVVCERKWTRPSVELLASMTLQQLDADIFTAQAEIDRRLSLPRD